MIKPVKDIVDYVTQTGYSELQFILDIPYNTEYLKKWDSPIVDMDPKILICRNDLAERFRVYYAD